MILKRQLLTLTLLGAFGAANAAGLLVNADFESDPILGDGQTLVGEGQKKLTETSPEAEGYLDAISGVVGWSYSMDRNDDGPLTGTDVGLGRGLGLGDGNESQILFTNRWGQRAVQTVEGVTFLAGYTYTIGVRCYLPLDEVGDFKVGLFQLYAGTPTDPSDLHLLNELGYTRAVSPGASSEYHSEFDHLINGAGWVDLSVSYTVAGDASFIGENLTVSMLTEAGSEGPVYWDNLTLRADAVPEPFTLSLGFGALALVLRRRRR
jgi:hypothetical protein